MSLTYVTATIDCTTGGMSTPYAVLPAPNDHICQPDHRRHGRHDRGALAAFRPSMDHPDSVQRLVIMDGLPESSCRVLCSSSILDIMFS